MEFGIHSPFPVQGKLTELINDKVEMLSGFYSRINSTDVYLKKEDREALVEVRIKMPQKELFAKSRTESFEKSTIEVFDKIKKQLVKKVELMNTHR